MAVLQVDSAGRIDDGLVLALVPGQHGEGIREKFTGGGCSHNSPRVGQGGRLGAMEQSGGRWNGNRH